jgi:ATP-binding cassette subfamily C protein/ATP-binding cassette subfamily C protein LapB
MTETIINPTQLENYFKEESDFLNCLQPFLNSLGWYGAERTVIESLPHFSNSLDITKFVKVMESLGYKLTSKFQCHNDIRIIN